MKFAPVCPINIYEHLASLGPQYLGDYFLLLAHDVLEYEDRYRALFTDRDIFMTRPTIIMDNSVIELGDAVDAKTLFHACEIVGASCLAMPDVLQDGVATVNRTRSFLTDWYSMKATVDRDYPKMFIPQGKDIGDFMDCVFQARLMHIPMDWIGIARNLTGRVFYSRILAASFIHTFVGDAKLHLLGFSTDRADDVATINHTGKFVLGIDSAEPLRLGTAGVNLDRINEPGTTFTMPDPGPRGTWWEDTLKLDYVDTQAPLALAENVRYIRGRIEAC